MIPDDSPDRFEAGLKSALRRESPPPDFAARVLARVPRRRPYLPWAVAAGLALSVLIPAAYQGRRAQYVHEEQAQQAKQKLIAALRITGAKLSQTRTRVHRQIARI